MDSERTVVQLVANKVQTEHDIYFTGVLLAKKQEDNKEKEGFFFLRELQHKSPPSTYFPSPSGRSRDVQSCEQTELTSTAVISIEGDLHSQ